MSTIRKMSRRAFLPLVAGAALSPVLLTPSAVRAQALAWQIYRPEGLGFEVEMPGEPKIETEKGERDDILVRSIDAHVEVDQISFSANFQEFRKRIFVEEEVAAQRIFARELEAKMRVTPFTTNGFDGREIAMESDGLNAIMRIVVVTNRRIMVSVLGQRSIQADANVRRFLDSLKLLP